MVLTHANVFKQVSHTKASTFQIEEHMNFTGGDGQSLKTDPLLLETVHRVCPVCPWIVHPLSVHFCVAAVAAVEDFPQSEGVGALQQWAWGESLELKNQAFLDTKTVAGSDVGGRHIGVRLYREN